MMKSTYRQELRESRILSSGHYGQGNSLHIAAELNLLSGRNSYCCRFGARGILPKVSCLHLIVVVIERARVPESLLTRVKMLRTELFKDDEATLRCGCPATSWAFPQPPECYFTKDGYTAAYLKVGEHFSRIDTNFVSEYLQATSFVTSLDKT